VNRIVGWYQSRTRVPDDRGQLVEVRDRNRGPKSQPFRFRRPDWPTLSIAARVRHVLLAMLVAIGGMWMVIAFSFVVFLMFKLVASPALQRDAAILLGVGVVSASIVGSLVSGVAVLSGRERREALQVAGARLAQGACGRCSFLIGDLPSQTDGCTTCPECAAAWRLDLWKRDWARRRDPCRSRIKSAPPFDWFIICLLVKRPVSERRRRLWSRFILRFIQPTWIELLILSIGALFVYQSGLGPEWLGTALKADLFVYITVLVLLLFARGGWILGRTYRSEIACWVRRGTCPHCEQPLRDEPSHGDKATLCESCGAAWRGRSFVPLRKVAI
jgi:hypothetical protein